MTKRATIIGGGIVGLASALALARRGMDVTLVGDDIDRQAASWGNAGHIAIEQVEPLASRAAIRSAPGRLFSRGGALAFPPAQWRYWLPFGLRLLRASAPDRFAAGKAALSGLIGEAMPAWRRLAGSLPGESLLREDGHFVTWSAPETARAGRSAWGTADLGTAHVRDATAKEMQALAGMGIVSAGAIRFTNTGQIADLACLADAMEGALRDAGGRIVPGKARLIAGNGEAGLSIDGEVVPDPGLIVVTAGVRSGALLRPLGHRAPIIAERGYHIRAADADWPADMPPLVFEDRSMIVTRYAGCVQAASFVEPGDLDAPPDPAKWLRLEAHVAALGLPMRPPFTRWMGARPTLPDYLPAIGASRRAANLLYAFGHQHLGLTLSAVTGEIVAALATNERPAVDIAAFDIGRFEVRGRV
ncbi:NAD(P)/FAD-dependent oxidoreductase [Sphingomonas oryzagri]